MRPAGRRRELSVPGGGPGGGVELCPPDPAAVAVPRAGSAARERNEIGGMSHDIKRTNVQERHSIHTTPSLGAHAHSHGTGYSVTLLLLLQVPAPFPRHTVPQSQSVHTPHTQKHTHVTCALGAGVQDVTAACHAPRRTCACSTPDSRGERRSTAFKWRVVPFRACFRAPTGRFELIAARLSNTIPRHSKRTNARAMIAHQRRPPLRCLDELLDRRLQRVTRRLRVAEKDIGVLVVEDGVVNACVARRAHRALHDDDILRRPHPDHRHARDG